MTNILHYIISSKKFLLNLMIFTASLLSCYGQGIVTPINTATLALNNASEGDYFIGTENPVGLIYLGLQNGTYQPLFTNGLSEIINFNNNADANRIIELPPPISPQDIATKLYVDSKSAESIYAANGSLTSHRILNGMNFNLTYENIALYTNKTITYNLTATNDINFSAGVKNILKSSTNVTGNIAISGIYLDSDGNPGTQGQLLSSTNIGTKWITSSVSPKTIQYYTSESAKTYPAPEYFFETWPISSTTVGQTHSIIITEKSILSFNYTFTFFIDPNYQEGNRITYVNVKNPDGTIAFDHLSLHRNTPLKSVKNDNNATAYLGTNYGSKKVVLTTPGIYTIELITLGDMPVYTGSNDFDANIVNALYNNTGWNFDITIIPQQI
ncbi:MAG: hypothetical protein JKY08_01970 [Flavobacteriaceae bacterium]|nr:hypothetical protein [Flavobacteriaceae bacterium]